MKITVVGGGNIGTQFAVHAAETGNEVTVYTSSPDLYDGHLSIVDESGETIHEGQLIIATADPELAFKCAELILVTVPAMVMSKMADIIFYYGNKDAFIGVVPGNGGSECMLKKCIERGNTFFALERVPAIARLVKKGKTVKSIGYREELHVASIPRGMAERCAEIVRDIFNISCLTIPCMLNLTMTPSNPILHTSRLYTLFKDWNEGIKYDSVPLFYEEWTDTSSEILLSMDDEEQAICCVIPELSYVKSLRDHYDALTVECMTKKIRSIQAFKGLTTPTTVVDGGIVPDLHSRYFTADFAYGLGIIQQVGVMAEVNTPIIDKVMAWYNSISVEKDEFRYEYYGITKLDELKAFYSQ